MINQTELKEMLVSLETERVEKTISLTDTNKFGEAICSFCNDLSGKKLPGYLLIGVNDDGSLNGTKIEESFLQKMLGFRTDGRIIPPPAMIVEKFSFPEGDVAVVEVQPSRIPPVRFKGKVCVRVGLRKGIANEDEERILSEKRSTFARSFDTQPCYGSSIEDLNTDIFKLTYLPKAIDEETLRINGRKEKEQLASLKFYDLQDNCPTNAGMLLFGKNPLYFMPGAYVQYVRFKGLDETSDFEYENKFSGDLTTQMRFMEEFIKSLIIKKVLYNIGEQHQYNFPLFAIKELLFNAIIHRNYQSNAPIKFYEYSDRIEISNAGGLYGKARPENFPTENDYRNPILAEAAYNLGYVNRFNLGVKRAIAALKKNGNPPPHFTVNQSTSFSVKIYKKKI